jgi:hypothetical protein
VGLRRRLHGGPCRLHRPGASEARPRTNPGGVGPTAFCELRGRCEPGQTPRPGKDGHEGPGSRPPRPFP